MRSSLVKEGAADHGMPTHEKPLNPAGCALKLTIGSCAVIALAGVAVWLASNIAWLSDRPWALGLLGALAMVIGVEVATVILSPGSGTPFNILGAGGMLSPSKDYSPDALLRRGEAEREEFLITRTIVVEDNGASGEAYFCQLGNDAGVLLLSGQYLYDFEAIEEVESSNGEEVPRRFPATRFSTIRSTRDGGLYDLVPEGEVFEPERAFPCYPKGLHQKLDQLLDGYVWKDRNLDEIAVLLHEPKA